MKKRSLLNVLATFLVFTVLPILFSSSAGAYVYDDFTTTGIDLTKWVDGGPNAGLYSQPGTGNLYFNDPSPGGHLDNLLSVNPITGNPITGAFFVSMQYSNLSANNTTLPGQGKLDTIALIVGSTSNRVVMLEDANTTQYFFEAQSIISGTVTGFPLPPPSTNATGGTLGIYYNGVLGAGSMVSFWYNTGSGWWDLAGFDPDFLTTPHIGISGEDLYGQSLSFDVTNVSIDNSAPVPEPLSLLLLGPGLVGLAAVRRRFRK